MMSRKPLLLTTLVIVGSYRLVWLFLHALGFDAFRSDVQDYWHDSLNWQRPFNPFHPPAYPLLIALIRTVTFGQMPPLVIMGVVAFSALLAGAVLVYKLLQAARTEKRHALIGMLLFAWWPFVGLTYAVYPIADSFAILLLMLGLYALQRSGVWAAGLMLGLALTAHKALWPVVGLVLAVSFLPSRKTFLKLLPWTVTPLAALWIAGSIYHGSLLWLLASDLRVEVASRSAFPVLDGILGTLTDGGLKGILKGGVVLSVAAGAAILAISNSRSTTLESRLSIAIGLAILFLCLVLNKWVIWGAVRFSRILVLPLMWKVGQTRLKSMDTWLWLVVLALCLATQFAFAWYMATVFQWEP